MPTYEYECTACGQHIEVYQRFTEDPLTECGVCGGALRKVFHPAGIVFKGSGFYATDSRSTAKSGSGDTGEKAGKGGEKGGEKAGAGADTSSSKSDADTSSSNSDAGTSASSSSSSERGSSSSTRGGSKKTAKDTS